MNSTHDTSPQPPPASSERIPFIPHIVATGLFSGYSPVASGTAGSIVGVLIYLIPGFASAPVLAVAIAAAFFGGVAASAKVAAIVGNRVNADAKAAKEMFQKGGHAEADPSIVVIDEIAGMWISLFFLPMSWPAILLAFFFFRAFDIVKPYPAAQLEQLPHGWGIMLDDVVAGIYANIAARIGLALLALVM